MSDNLFASRCLWLLLMVLTACGSSKLAPAPSGAFVPCQNNAERIVTAEGSTCRCLAGFEANGAECVDVDECASNVCSARATCTNQPGSYTCNCEEGFVGDGDRCVKLIGGVGSYFGCVLDDTVGLSCWGGDFGAFGDGNYVRLPVLVSRDVSWKNVSAANGAMCGVRGDGTIWCAGSNRKGRFGTGALTVELPLSPMTQISVESDWALVSLDYQNTCALKQNGSLWCWGTDDHGITGPVEVDDQTPVPTRIGVESNWRSVSVKSLSACAINTANELFCFGANESGQLGLGAGAPTKVTTPTRVGSDANWRIVEAGYTSCAIKNDGSLWCWGTLPSVNTPTRVGTQSDWVQLSQGGGHMCARRSGGEVSCVGSNFYGELGRGASGESSSEWVALDGTFDDVAVLLSTTCLTRRTAAGANTTLERVCFGDNASGQLGNGTGGAVLSPAQTGTDADWASVSVGAEGACGIRGSAGGGSLYCWGYGLSSASMAVDTPTRIGTDSDWTSVSVGDRNVCGTRSNNKVFCFGSNTAGALGLGSTALFDTPTEVVVSGKTLIDVALNDSGNGCARASTGELYCWGANDYGQLGNNTTSSVATTSPALVSGGLSWQSVKLGGSRTFVMGRVANGRLRCFGYNNSSQCGDNFAAAQYTLPDEVSITEYTHYAVSDRSTCGYVAGDVDCWGQEFTGLPQTQFTLTNVTQMAAGGSGKFCAIHSGGALRCWGRNDSGSLGIGSFKPATYSQGEAVSVFTDWRSVSIGRSSSCGVRQNNTLWCWGGSFAGALGQGTSFSLTGAVSPL